MTAAVQTGWPYLVGACVGICFGLLLGGAVAFVSKASADAFVIEQIRR
jgi:hypothetical protein